MKSYLIRPEAPHDERHALDSEYVEVMYTPIIGAAGISIIRLMARTAASGVESFELTDEQLAAHLAVPVVAAQRRMNRLVRFRVLFARHDGSFTLPLGLRPLTNAQLDKLAPYMAAVERTYQLEVSA